MLHLYRLGAVIPLVVGVIAAIAAYRLSVGTFAQPGPGLWPFLVALVIVFSSAVLLLADSPSDYEPWTGRSLKVLAGVVALMLFIVIFGLMGFVLPAAAFLLVWVRFLAKESWKTSGLVAVLGAVSIFVVFQTLLGVRFPVGPVAIIFGLA